MGLEYNDPNIDVGQKIVISYNFIPSITAWWLESLHGGKMVGKLDGKI